MQIMSKLLVVSTDFIETSKGEEIMHTDSTTVTGFNVGVNDGRDAGHRR
jgi:hypothetical protein